MFFRTCRAGDAVISYPRSSFKVLVLHFPTRGLQGKLQTVCCYLVTLWLEMVTYQHVAGSSVKSLNPNPRAGIAKDTPEKKFRSVLT